MLKPEQVPHAAMNALLLALRQRRGGKEAIAAALNAWPEARLIRNALSNSPKYIKLPVEGLTQEDGDD